MVANSGTATGRNPSGERSPRWRIGLAEAVALGALQGPAELLPVSSSGHLALLPATLGWPYSRLDPELRKAFEVALHAGSAAALPFIMPRPRTPLALLALTSLPAAAAGFLLERPIERRLGTARAVARAQIVAGVLLALADRRRGSRAAADATGRDALLLGIAQACALVPGVSRNGATLTAARAIGFDRPAARALSREAALPIMVAAAGWKARRLLSGGLEAHLRVPFAAGALAAAASAVAGRRLLLYDGSELPVAAYRVSLGVTVLVAGARSRPRPRGDVGFANG